MSREMTNKEAISNLNHIYGIVSPDIQRSLDLAIKALEQRPQGEYETACNVLLSLEQIVRRSDGWEDSAVEAVHNAIQTAIKCMHERPHIIDNCDMNVFEPEKYMKGGAE